MDIRPPTQKTHGGMDVYQYAKYKLLRSLECFVHFLTQQLALKQDYMFKLSLKIRSLLRNFKFSQVRTALSQFHLKGKLSKAKPYHPHQTIVSLDGELPKVASIGRSDEDSELSSGSLSDSTGDPISLSLSDD